MHFKTIRKASNEWGISERRIHTLCSDGRVEGAQKVAGVRLLPKEAMKPEKLSPGRISKKA